MSSYYIDGFVLYLKARLQDMFVPFVLDWDNIQFENSFSVPKHILILAMS